MRKVRAMRLATNKPRREGNPREMVKEYCSILTMILNVNIIRTIALDPLLNSHPGKVIVNHPTRSRTRSRRRRTNWMAATASGTSRLPSPSGGDRELDMVEDVQDESGNGPSQECTAGAGSLQSAPDT